MSTFNIRTTTAGGAIQKAGNMEESPVNLSGIISRSNDNSIVRYRIGNISDTIIVGTDTVNFDGVPFVGTAQQMQDKLQSIFNLFYVG